MSTLNVDNRERVRVRDKKKNEGDDFVGRKK